MTLIVMWFVVDSLWLSLYNQPTSDLQSLFTASHTFLNMFSHIEIWNVHKYHKYYKKV